MIREKAIEEIKNYENYPNGLSKECRDYIIKALKQESNIEQFVKWVATEIFDNDWKYNRYVFAEIACRKLVKLGIVRKNGDTWELVKPQESEEEDGNVN